MDLRQKYKRQVTQNSIVWILVSLLCIPLFFMNDTLENFKSILVYFVLWIFEAVEWGISIARKTMLDDLLKEYDIKPKPQNEQGNSN